MVSRRTFVKLAGSTSVVGAAGCSENSEGQNSGTETTPTDEQGSQFERVGVSSYVRGGAWVRAFWEAGEFYAKDHGIEWNLVSNTESVEKMVQTIQQFTNQEMDGILTAIWQSDAANEAIAGATEKDIPVFTADGDATSPKVKMHVGTNNVEDGKVCAQQLQKKLREQKPDQDHYRVLNFRGPLAGEVSNNRNDGFVEEVKTFDDMSVVQTINAEHARDTAQQKALEWLNANDAPDAVHASNSAMALGVMTAIERQDLLYKREDDNHILISQIGAGPEVLNAIDEGYSDVAIALPNYFYMPIALHYMQKWHKDGGDDALPDIGTEVAAEDLEIPSAQHKGVELWSEPIWAPAKIVEAHGHRRFQTQSITVDKSNTDNPWVWGNIWGDR